MHQWQVCTNSLKKETGFKKHIECIRTAIEYCIEFLSMLIVLECFEGSNLKIGYRDVTTGIIHRRKTRVWSMEGVRLLLKTKSIYFSTRCFNNLISEYMRIEDEKISSDEIRSALEGYMNLSGIESLLSERCAHVADLVSKPLADLPFVHDIITSFALGQPLSAFKGCKCNVYCEDVKPSAPYESMNMYSILGSRAHYVGKF